MNNQKNVYILIVGGVLSLVGAIMQLLELNYAPYVFSAGVFFIVSYQFLESLLTRKITDFRQKRLQGLCFLSSVLLIPAAYFMFKHKNTWVAFVLIYALTTLFLSFRSKSTISK